MTCGVWILMGPCGAPVVERLVFYNPNCGGGPINVCATHLIEYLGGALLLNTVRESVIL